jgi:hypothetical protein
MKFALPSSISSCGAQCASGIGRRRVDNLQIVRRTPVGEPQRSVKRLKLTPPDRLLWAWLCAVWKGWRSALVIVQPDTMIAWHRQSFRLF